MTYRIGIDIGGTFTDFTLVDPTGARHLWKEDSTRAEPDAAIFRGLDALAEQRRLRTGELLEQTSLLVHGSTIATNTVIERDAQPIGLICTEGFRDVVYFRDGFKPERFNIRLPRPTDFVPRSLRIGVPERIDAQGQTVVPLDEVAVRAAAGRLRDARVAAVAVAFLWSVVRDDHERRAAEILCEELDVPVICSCDVLPEIREWERTSATVLSAYVLPRLDAYLRRFERRLADLGLPNPPLIMQITGGCASVDEVLRKPVTMLASGPAAAPAAAAHVAATARADNVITMDMGGTSLDVSMIRNGDPVMSRNVRIEEQPIGVAAVDVHSIGAGGGSIGWIDDGGVLRVGPESAGSYPGPACYGEGGERPTVTDANVVLGYLRPEGFLGGRRTLRADLAVAAVQRHVADPLGVTVVEAAAGMLEVVDTNMVAGIRAISVERGIDPRSFAMVSAGGAGSLHAARLAAALGIEMVLVPREASTFCSFGMAVADVRHDHTVSWHQMTDRLDRARLDALYRELEAGARARLLEAGFAPEEIVLERSVDARYPNQVHEITVPIATTAAHGPEHVAELERRFHDEHRSLFSYALPELPVEILHWRLAAYGRSRAGALTTALPADDGLGAPATSVEHVMAYSYVERALTSHALFELDALPAGAEIAGPAIVRSPITTILVGDRDSATLRADGALVVRPGRRQAGRAAA